MARNDSQSKALWSAPPIPAASSTRYLSRVSTKNPDRSQSHTIVGVHVVLCKGHENKLWDILHYDNKKRVDPDQVFVPTKSLIIACDKLEIEGELCVPEADVAIFTRRLIWKGNDAAINTSALNWQKARDADDKAPGRNGVTGRRAGNLKIFVSELTGPVDKDRPRILAIGGNGQDPGAGRNGLAGSDMDQMTSTKKQYGSNMKKNVVVYGFPSAGKIADHALDPPATYVDMSHDYHPYFDWSPQKWGNQDRWPGSGTDAVAPGIPGNGGEGGSVTTNSRDLGQSVRVTGGRPGGKPADAIGGRAGSPTRSARYKARITTVDGYFSTSRIVLTQVDPPSGCHETQEGRSFAAQEGRAGGDGKVAMADGPLHWLHPLALERVLEYVQDIYLAGDLAEAERQLVQLQGVLNQKMPDNGAWTPLVQPLWTASRNDIAAHLARLRAHLDYYGNPAGYQPTLSLAAHAVLYKSELDRGLRTLLLANWINDRVLAADAATEEIGAAMQGLDADSAQATTRIAAAETQMGAALGLIEQVNRDIGDIMTDLGGVEKRLTEAAEKAVKEKNERQATIKTLVNIASALCQVIPVGQPVLGGIGTMADAAEKYFNGGEKDFSALFGAATGLTKVCVTARATALTAEAEMAAAKAEPYATLDEAMQAEKIKKLGAAAARWNTVGEGLDSGSTFISEALKKRQAPDSEVAAYLDRLKADSPEWADLTDRIAALGDKKTEMAATLSGAIDALNKGFARRSANAATQANLHVARGKSAGEISPDAVFFVRQLAKRSEITLRRYLYFLVKAYETSAFTTIDVDWQLAKIVEKINGMTRPEAGFSLADLARQAQALGDVFNSNINAVRTQLLANFNSQSQTAPVFIEFSAKQTEGLIDRINRAGSFTFNPVDYRLMLGNEQLVWLSDVDLVGIDFDAGWRKKGLPAGANVIISLIPASTGVIRKGAKLYTVYSEAPRQWHWTITRDGNTKAQEAKTQQDVLNFLLGDGAERIGEKYARVPFLSDFTVKVTTTSETPPIERIKFKLSRDFTALDSDQRLLKVRMIGPSGGAVVTCTPDLEKRGDGGGSMARIYQTGTRVSLAASGYPKTVVFDGWRIIGSNGKPVKAAAAATQLVMDDHFEVECNWKPAGKKRRALRTMGAAPAAEPKVIRAEPDEDAAVLDMVEPGESEELLGRTVGPWQEVNFRGVIGWIERQPEEMAMADQPSAQ